MYYFIPSWFISFLLNKRVILMGVLLQDLVSLLQISEFPLMYAGEDAESLGGLHVSCTCVSLCSSPLEKFSAVALLERVSQPSLLPSQRSPEVEDQFILWCVQGARGCVHSSFLLFLFLPSGHFRSLMFHSDIFLLLILFTGCIDFLILFHCCFRLHLFDFAKNVLSQIQREQNRAGERASIDSFTPQILTVVRELKSRVGNSIQVMHVDSRDLKP